MTDAERLAAKRAAIRRRTEKRLVQSDLDALTLLEWLEAAERERDELRAAIWGSKPHAEASHADTLALAQWQERAYELSGHLGGIEGIAARCRDESVAIKPTGNPDRGSDAGRTQFEAALEDVDGAALEA